jgi:hypothetical protein
MRGGGLPPAGAQRDARSPGHERGFVGSLLRGHAPQEARLPAVPAAHRDRLHVQAVVDHTRQRDPVGGGRLVDGSRSVALPAIGRATHPATRGPLCSATRVPGRASRQKGGAQLTGRERALPGAVELHGVAVHPPDGGRSSALRAVLPGHPLAHDTHSSAATGGAAGTPAHDARPEPRPFP